MGPCQYTLYSIFIFHYSTVYGIFIVYYYAVYNMLLLRS